MCLKNMYSTYDRCYLGRYSGIDEAPREVIASILGVKRVEMSHNQSDSLCLIMLEDAVKTTGLEDSLRVMDLNELVEMALDPIAG